MGAENLNFDTKLSKNGGIAAPGFEPLEANFQTRKTFPDMLKFSARPIPPAMT